LKHSNRTQNKAINCAWLYICCTSVRCIYCILHAKILIFINRVTQVNCTSAWKKCCEIGMQVATIDSKKKLDQIWREFHIKSKFIKYCCSTILIQHIELWFVCFLDSYANPNYIVLRFLDLYAKSNYIVLWFLDLYAKPNYKYLTSSMDATLSETFVSCPNQTLVPAEVWAKGQPTFRSGTEVCVLVDLNNSTLGLHTAKYNQILPVICEVSKSMVCITPI
jgi:hypothetical protein